MTLSVSGRRATVFLFTGLVLAIPLIAMQWSQEVRWTLMDFLVAGGLLLGAGLFCEWILRAPLKKPYRILLLLGAVGALLLIWMELAVGIFGTPLAGS